MGLVQLFGQILPLLVFIIVDSISSNIKTSIIAVIVFAAGQLLFFYHKAGAFDWFVLLDVNLIAGLGTISIIFKNEMFFKIIPAMVEAAAITFILVLVFSPYHFVLNYLGRMMPKGMILNPATIGSLKTMLLLMSGYMLVHIGAVLYTAFYLSRRMWCRGV